MKIEGVCKKTDFIAINVGDKKWVKCTDAVADFALKNKGKEFKTVTEENGITNKIEILGTSEIKPSDFHKEPVNWDAKDRRIVRQNALSHATTLYIETMKVAGKHINVDQGKEVITHLAEHFEEWVYREKDDSQPKIEHESIGE